MIASLIFMIGIAKTSNLNSQSQKHKELSMQAKFNKKFARDFNRPYLKGRK